MTFTIVPSAKTPATDPEAVSVLCSAYEQEIKRRPLPRTLAILVAQSALETGQWDSMWNHNWGNIRGSYRGHSMSIKGADEIIDGRRVTGAEVESGFRAYPDAVSGAIDFIRFLGVDTTPNNGRPNRYQKAWDAAEAGDVSAYCHELAEAGYYTASPTLYEKGVRRLVDQFLPLCEAHLGHAKPAPADDTGDLMAEIHEGLDAAEAGLRRARAAAARVRV